MKKGARLAVGTIVGAGLAYGAFTLYRKVANDLAVDEEILPYAEDDEGSVSGESNKGISAELLSILACPKCKGNVALNDDQTKLICQSCAREYEIKNGIPIMLAND